MKKLLLTFAFVLTLFVAKSQSAVSLIYLYTENAKHHEMLTVYQSEDYDGLIHYWATWHENMTQCDVQDMGDYAIVTVNYSWGSSEKFKVGSASDDGFSAIYMEPIDGGEQKIFELITPMD